MRVGNLETAGVPALECQQERAGPQDSGLLGWSCFLPLSRPSIPFGRGSVWSSRPGPAPNSLCPNRTPRVPSTGRGRSFRTWLSLGVGKGAFSGLSASSLVL